MGYLVKIGKFGLREFLVIVLHCKISSIRVGQIGGILKMALHVQIFDLIEQLIRLAK